jgi:S-adenosyl-L-methionine hydrolase (adenosine-forming)
MIRPIITLTTDFGLSDSYVAQMKGVILGISPDVILIDVTHQIPPQDCAAASELLAEAVAAFPPGTIHLVVVDPGVGTDRRAVAVEARGRDESNGLRFVAPDNGVLTEVLRSRTVERAVRLTDRRFFLPEVSNTFHGRDIFGPVAAHWSRGVDLAQFGPPLESPLIQLEVHAPVREGSRLRGQIMRVDSFGNLITNIPADLLPQFAGDRLTVVIQSQRILGISRTYGKRPPGELVALVGSSGRLEIAVCCGNATEILAAFPGDTVEVEGLQ